MMAATWQVTEFRPAARRARKAVTVFKIEPSTPNAYFMPGADPSPLIAPGTVYGAPAGGTPLDHTSIPKTVQQRWNLPALTKRDAAAPGFGDVLTLATPRTDDVLAGVTVPTSGAASPAAGQLSHLEQIREELIPRRWPAGEHPLPPGGAPA